MTELSSRRGNSFGTIRCTTMIWATGAPVARLESYGPKPYLLPATLSNTIVPWVHFFTGL